MIIQVTNTTSSTITLGDLSGFSISTGQSVDLSENFSLNRICESSDLVAKIAVGELIVSDGTTTFDAATAIQYVTVQNVIVGPKNSSGLLRVQSTPRPLGTLTKFIGVGDDPANPLTYGTGQAIIHDHKIGDPATEYLYLDLNTIVNTTYIRTGALQWQNANFDKISMTIVPNVVQVQSSSNTNYSVYGNVMIIPAAGNGTISITSDITLSNGGLVQNLPNDLGVKGTGFWNADWNSSTKLFENITAAPLGNGNYNMFCYEVPLSSYAISLPLLGNSSVILESPDVDVFPHGSRLKFKFVTNGDDHDWKFCGIVNIFRSAR